MINIIFLKLHNSFKEKTCDGVVRIVLSTQRSKVQSLFYFILFLLTNEMDEKIHKHLNNFKKLVAFKKELPRKNRD
jgi:hypothetical protein